MFSCWLLPQGAPASRATLGCDLQPLRGKEHAVVTHERANLELLSFSSSKFGLHRPRVGGAATGRLAPALRNVAPHRPRVGGSHDSLRLKALARFGRVIAANHRFHRHGVGGEPVTRSRLPALACQSFPHRHRVGGGSDNALRNRDLELLTLVAAVGPSWERHLCRAI